LCDENAKPFSIALSAGNISDYDGADVLLKSLPKTKFLLADRGYDSRKVRKMLTDQGIEPCIPSRCNRISKIEYDKELYKQRHKVENCFAKLKDWRRISTRYDRCPEIFFSAVLIAISFLFYLK
jgi:transposase